MEDRFNKSKLTESEKPPLIILTGPTAVGKTGLSIALAKAVNGSVISADSMQVYRGMDIGSAKIRPEEMQGVPHYLIDELEPEEPFHVVRFQQMAKTHMQEIYRQGRIPILVGGTGFYIQAVLYDIDFTETTDDPALRLTLETEAMQQGPEALHEELRKVDPEAAEAIHPNNVKRVIRALEYFRHTGEKISLHNEQEHGKASPYTFCYFVLNENRETLYEKINLRIDRMLEQGLQAEVQALKDRGCTRDMVSMKGLGYKEMLDYLDGEISLEEAVYRIKRDTRHFAKRQITWFKREPDTCWIQKEDYEGEEAILEEMLNRLRERGMIF